MGVRSRRIGKEHRGRRASFGSAGGLKVSRPPSSSRLAEVTSALLRAVSDAGREVQRVDVDRNGTIKLVMAGTETPIVVLAEDQKIVL
jgi:hypothetical protein